MGERERVSVCVCVHVCMCVCVCVCTQPKLSSDDRTVNRHKKLFGSLLMGHLLKARTCLENERGSKKAELQKKQEGRVLHKLDREKQNLRELRDREVQEKKDQEYQKLVELDQSIALCECTSRVRESV
eukprot:GHVU01177503.1.p2 GENE.GHVU01177503.1~~GHVU01177503.1.p2  ORF type:complete len:128 (+),score=29.51 GHVU01177503.1:605-988(+)